MKKFLTTPVGRLRLIGLLEGISLVVLVGIAVPLKYGFANQSWVKAIGPVHGLLFVLFVINTLQVGVEQRWYLESPVSLLYSLRYHVHRPQNPATYPYPSNRMSPVLSDFDLASI